jgi:hypothetical protein
MTDPYGPYEPLEERLGSRAAFEAHQKSEVERTARVLAHRRKVRREALMILLRFVLVIAAICVAIYLLATRTSP